MKSKSDLNNTKEILKKINTKINTLVVCKTQIAYLSCATHVGTIDKDYVIMGSVSGYTRRGPLEDMKNKLIKELIRGSSIIKKGCLIYKLDPSNGWYSPALRRSFYIIDEHTKTCVKDIRKLTIKEKKALLGGCL
jgi:hypothetical protein